MKKGLQLGDFLKSSALGKSFSFKENVMEFHKDGIIISIFNEGHFKEDIIIPYDTSLDM